MTPRTVLPASPFVAPQRALPPLTRLDEYEIEGVLAQSSLAVIYRAFDHALKLHVAIKEYLPDALVLRSAKGAVALRSPSDAQRFEAGVQAFVVEAQTLARCAHPSLLRVLRLMHANGTVYRVMPYAAGVTLLEHRRRLGTAPKLAVLCQWLEGLLAALAALHAQGQIHGAVAPGNILRLADEQLLLLDFEAVRKALVGDGSRGMPPTLQPCFAPIEQTEPAAGRPVGPWSDLYATAASLHFCVTGQLPAALGAAAAARRFEGFAAHWQRHHPGATMPQDLSRLYGSLDACLADEPSQRPQSVAAFRQLLGRGSIELSTAVIAPPAAATPTAAPPPGVASALPPTAVGASASADASYADPGDGARIIADLDQTFAAIAARANEPAAAREAPDAAPADAVPATTGAGFAPSLAASEEPQVQTEPPAASSFASRPRPRALALQGALITLVLGLAIGVGLWWQGRADDERAAAKVAAEARVDAAARADAATRAAVPLQAEPAPASAAVSMPPPRVDSSSAAGSSERTQSTPPPAGAAPPAPAKTAAAARKPAEQVSQPKSRPPKPQRTKPLPAQAKLPASPTEACGQRTQFALYRCMHTQCAKPQWHDHVQCERLRSADALP